MKKPSTILQPHWRLPAYGLFLTLGAFTTLFTLLASPSDPKNAVFLGYSLELILLGGGILVLGSALLFLTLKLVRQPEQSLRLWGILSGRGGVGNAALWTALLGFLSLWILLFLPTYRLGSLASYTSRLLPILVWLAVTCAVTVLILLFERRQESLGTLVLANRTGLWMGLAVMAIFILLAAVTVFTGFGIRNPDDYWYGAGVPVLGLQVLLSVVMGTLTAWLSSGWSEQNPRRLDALICIALFILTAFLWAREPLRPNYFFPDTAKNLIYPYSDSATFDMASQFALIGQGLFNGLYNANSLYSAFLTYLHLFAGQDIERLMTAQSLIFAAFPVVIYLLGRELHSRALGVAAGVLVMLRGLNAISGATWIDLAGPKSMLTDFPTAIGVALLLLFALKWLRNPSAIHHAVFAGGMLGLSILLRTHVLLLMPALIAFILIFGLRIKWSLRLVGSLALILGMLSATTPWDLRNRVNGSPLFYIYYSRIGIVLKYRYGMDIDVYQPQSPAAAATPSTLTQSTPVVPPPESETPPVEIEVLPPESETLPPDDAVCVSSPCKISNHLLHNLVTSIVFLPSSLVFDDLWNVSKESAPYWRAGWAGEGIGFTEGSLIFINLALISLGLGLAWERRKWAGILPVGIFLGYLLSNSLALTSGGRYITPVDWIVILYFVLGILQLVFWAMRWAGLASGGIRQPEENSGTQTLKSAQYFKAFSALVFIAILGASILVSERLFERRYQLRPQEETLASLEQTGLLERSGYSRAELAEFLSNPDAVMLAGNALYPRYYRSGDGESDRSTYYRWLDYQRLVFTVIGPHSLAGEGVVAPGDIPNMQIHDVDVVVIGCRNTSYYAPFIDAVVVFVTSEPGYVYNRAPESPLQCPLQVPEK